MYVKSGCVYLWFSSLKVCVVFMSVCVYGLVPLFSMCCVYEIEMYVCTSPGWKPLQDMETKIGLDPRS